MAAPTPSSLARSALSRNAEAAAARALVFAWVFVAGCGWLDRGAGEVSDTDAGTGSAESTGGVQAAALGEGVWAECRWASNTSGSSATSDLWIACPFAVFPGAPAQIVNRGSVVYLPVEQSAAQAYVRIEDDTVELIEAVGPFVDPNLHLIDEEGRLAEWRRDIETNRWTLGVFDGQWSHRNIFAGASDLMGPVVLTTAAHAPMLGVFDFRALGSLFVLRETRESWSQDFVADVSAASSWGFGVDSTDRVFATSFEEVDGGRWQLASRSGNGTPLVLADVDAQDVGPLFYPGGIAPGGVESPSAMAAFFRRDGEARVYTSGAGVRTVPGAKEVALSDCVLEFDDELFAECSTLCREDVSGRTSPTIASSWIDQDRVVLGFVSATVSFEAALFPSCSPDGICTCIYDQTTRELDAQLQVMTLDVRTGVFAEFTELALPKIPGRANAGGHALSVSVDGPHVAFLVSNGTSVARILQLTLAL